MGIFNSDHEQRLQSTEKKLTQAADILENFKIMVEIQSTKIDVVKQMAEQLSERVKDLQDKYIQSEKKYIELNKAISDVALVVKQQLARHN